MKNKKSKIIAFILAFVLLFGTVIVTSVANTKTTDIQISTDKEELLEGESATVSVKVTTNYPVATMSIPVFYDKTLVNVSEPTAALTNYSVANVTTEVQAVDTERVYANTEIDSNKFGFVLATYIAGANEDVAELVDEVVLTFKITAKADALGNAIVKVVEESAKIDTNIKGMLYFGAATSGTKITSIPDNVKNITLTNAKANIQISNIPNTIALKEGAPFEAVIDTVNTCGYTGTIYGFDTLGFNTEWNVDGAIADFITTAYGDEYLEVVVGDAGVETTGTLINVLDKDGNVVETYVYIYFGDMDMDGDVGESEAGMASYYEMWYEGIDTLETFMAGDLDGDAYPGESDAGTMSYWAMWYEDMPLQVDVGAVAKDIAYEIF